jgi:ankyrin repeat protein
MIDHPNPRPILESVIYGAAGIARHEGLTRLLLERGADPNDEETPYHAAEGYDLAVLNALLESGKLDGTSMTTLLLRKADWHDTEGIRMLLEHGADPNAMTRWGHTALHQALRRDNRLVSIALLLDHGADPALKNIHNGMSAVSIAARRGRGDVLRLFEERVFDLGLTGVESLIAACAKADDDAIRALTGGTGAPGPGGGGPGSPRTGPGPRGGGLDPETCEIDQLIAAGGTLLAEFAGNGNTEGVRRLLNLGVDARALHGEGDGYWEITRESTALHVAAWRGWPGTVKMLIERGARVNALDGKGRTAMQLAVKACVDSYWTDRRTPESVKSLLNAGAAIDGVQIPCGYDEVDELLLKARETRG